MEQFFSNPFLFGEGILNQAHIFAGAWLDRLMLATTSLGSETFYLLVLPLLYWCWDRKKALYAGAVFLIAISLNDILKAVFRHPRPDPANLLPGIRELAARYAPSSPGFPSGHAQGSAAFWGALAVVSRSRKLQALLALLILLICYTRLYLGVHFMGDVLFGLLLGIACLALIIPAADFFATRYRRYHPAMTITALVILPLAAAVLLPGDYLDNDMGTISGFLIGAYLSGKKTSFNTHNRIAYQAAKAAIGIAGLAAIRFGLKAILPAVPVSGFVRYWLIGAWVSIGAPYVFHWIGPLRGETGPVPGSAS